ncbi:MAG: pyruvate kinase, partial [Acidimicrobiales bacterium]
MVARRTKIIATIGPSCEDSATLAAMVEAGMDVARLNLAHGPVEEHLERARQVRRVAAHAGRPVGILADLPGPKVRAATFPEGGLILAEGSTVALAPTPPGAHGASTGERIGVDDPGALADLGPGDRVVLGDGDVDLRVEWVDRRALTVTATVVVGGRLQGRPGVHLPSVPQGGVTPTVTDLELLDAVGGTVDAVAISFVRSASDLKVARAALAA